VRLHEKGGKRHEIPAHHKLEPAAGIREDGKTPLFPSAVGKTGMLTDKPRLMGHLPQLQRQTRWVPNGRREPPEVANDGKR
jgi:hypothetical protein